MVINRHIMWKGAQYTHILDDRDVDKYYESPKFESFVHLKQTTVKIIVYSTIETILYIDIENLNGGDSCNSGAPRVQGYAIRVKEGMNISCVCHYRDP